MTGFLWCVIGVLSLLSIWLRSSDEREERCFYSKRDELLKVVKKNINAGSVVEMPVYGCNEIVDCATGKKQLKYTEITCEGYWRDIYVTTDGEKVVVMKWQPPERKQAWDD